MDTEQRVVDRNMVVGLEYALWDVDGQLLDSSEDEGPLYYIHGHGQIIPGLEAALAGMALEDEQQVVVEPELAYGEYDPDAMEVVPLDVFPEDMELELGMSIDLYDEEADATVEATVAEIRADDVLLDLNHPLAGETLRFMVRIVELRPATRDEIDHGHVHVPGHEH